MFSRSHARTSILLALSFSVIGCTENKTDHINEFPTINGRAVDTNEIAVANARIVVMDGEKQTRHETMTASDGSYSLKNVPIDLLLAKEATILFESPRTDLPPLGTNEGDYIHQMPISVNEFIEMALVGVDTVLHARTAHVPLQAKGYKITDQLIRDGGELSWSYTGDESIGDLTVTLRIKPDSIVVPEDGQAEITLTPLSRFKSPMRIPDGGAGALWTLQPRDVVFDPPAEMRIEGETEKLLGTRASTANAGDPVEIYGATFVEGWTKFGDATIESLENGKVVFESVGGIIHKGAWGHVFGAEGANAGAEVTCYLCGEPFVCRVSRSLSVNPVQKDWSNGVPLDTDKEDLACQGCTNIGAPYAQGSIALKIPHQCATVQIAVIHPETNEEKLITLDCVNFNQFRYDSVVDFVGDNNCGG